MVQDVSYERAVALADAGRQDEALRIAEQLWLSEPDVVDHATLRAQLLADAGDLSAALAALDEAMARLAGPEAPAMGSTLAPMHRLASQGLLAHQYGTLLLRAGRQREALNWLHEAAQRNGLATGEWAAHFYAGVAAYELGDFARAGRYWHDLLYRAPDLGAVDILPLVKAHIDAAEEAGRSAEPLLRACLGRIALDSPDLLDLDADAGDALAAEQAARILADAPDHPEARRLRAPLRLGDDRAGALEDLAVYLRQQPDPQAQVRELAWRHAATEPGAQPAWQGFALTAASNDGAGYYHAAGALRDFIDDVPAARAALHPVVVQACRTGLERFEQYFASGDGDANGHGGNADPHLYSLLCGLLARSLPADAAHLEERLALHRKGMAASDFIEHWIDMLDAYAGAGQWQQVVAMAEDVLERHPVERDPSRVGWAFSRMMAAWARMGGGDALATATDALARMDARLDALPVEARSEAGHAMAHTRAHYAALLAAGAPAMDADDRADALEEIEALQRRALVVEDPWLHNRFGGIWRDLGDVGRALPLFEQAIALTEGDPYDQAPPRVQRARILVGEERHEEALADFTAAIAVREDWDAETCLLATQAALGLAQRDVALGWFERARAQGADKGRTRGLYAKVEAALKETRPAWKIWGV
ncbi:tetratricopeptide (TPR) repeat protein [Cupriavidus plantarum]|nr:tetratricopeptide (TPR) repeat protein [Cupriavidus plantarum]